MQFESTGRVRIYERGSKAKSGSINKGATIQVDCDWGIVLYYSHLIKEALGIEQLNQPRQGSHITIINERIHKVDFRKVKHWNRRKVKFSYDPKVVQGGGKDFINFYLKVDCNAALEIKKELGIKDSPRFLGHHITIGNTKNL